MFVNRTGVIHRIFDITEACVPQCKYWDIFIYERYRLQKLHKHVDSLKHPNTMSIYVISSNGITCVGSVRYEVFPVTFSGLPISMNLTRDLAPTNNLIFD